MPSTCPTCGEAGTPGALFCGSCGGRLVSAPPVAADAPDPLVGRTIDDTYAIEQKIGSGGMGDVYKAVHTKLDAPVALKIVKPALLAHPAMLHRFEREARAASRLHHPNIVTVTDFGRTADGMLFMVMEYVAGRSLAQAIADGAPMSEARVVHIGAQILTALAEAHACHILHRDLKPENVMLERRRSGPEAVKVLDFGIAKVLELGAAASTLTQAGLVCGTPGYMSPEQLRGGDVDPRSDLFSLGVVLYEMLTHELPFGAHTPMEMLHKHLSEPIVAPGERRGRPVSPALERLVLQVLAPDPGDRPASADEMREALLAAEIVADEVGEGERPRSTEVLPRPVKPRSGSSSARPGGPRTPGGGAWGTAPPSRSGDAAAPLHPSAGPGRAEPSRREPTRLRTAAPARATSALPGGVRRPSGTGTRRTSAAAAGGRPPVEKRIEERLAAVLGPVAPRLVRRFLAGAPSLPRACEQVATFIPGTAEREAFLAWCTAELGVPAATRVRAAPAPATPAEAWDPALLDRARKDLAAYVGPLARVIVRRVCPRAHDPRELYELLSLEIPGAAERDAFLRLVPHAGE